MAKRDSPEVEGWLVPAFPFPQQVLEPLGTEAAKILSIQHPNIWFHIRSWSRPLPLNWRLVGGSLAFPSAGNHLQWHCTAENNFEICTSDPSIGIESKGVGFLVQRHHKRIECHSKIWTFAFLSKTWVGGWLEERQRDLLLSLPWPLLLPSTLVKTKERSIYKVLMRSVCQKYFIFCLLVSTFVNYFLVIGKKIISFWDNPTFYDIIITFITIIVIFMIRWAQFLPWPAATGEEPGSGQGHLGINATTQAQGPNIIITTMVTIIITIIVITIIIIIMIRLLLFF